jgi:hypothetical protein
MATATERSASVSRLPKLIDAHILAHDEAEKRDQENKLKRMNKMADILSKEGPTKDIRAFLLAMHGIRGAIQDEYKSPEQKRYEEQEERFGLHALRLVFGEAQDGYAPYDAFAISPQLHDAHKRENADQAPLRQISAPFNMKSKRHKQAGM